MNNIITGYDLSGAAGQILMMLLIAFALGVIFGYLIRAPREGTQKERVIHVGPARMPVSLPSPQKEHGSAKSAPETSGKGFGKLQPNATPQS